MTLTLFRDAAVLDVGAGEIRPDQAVLVEDGLIREVGSTTEVTSTNPDRVIDAGGRTLMPGLIDGHVHVYFQSFKTEELMGWMPSYLVSKATRSLGDMLQRGFTTVRDTGGADFALAQAIDEGLVDGPRLIFGGMALTQTGGHADGRGPGDISTTQCTRCPTIGLIADGPEEVRKGAREILRTGAHHIKLMLSGGVTSPSDSISSVQYGDEEITAAVQVARAQGRYVTGHTYLAGAISNALRLGLRCIEHGNLIDESTVQDFVDNDAFLVPTLVTYNTMDRFGLEMGLSASSHAKNSEVLSSGLSALEMAHRGGVKLVYGSDLIGPQQVYQLEEFTIRAQVQPSIDVIRAATTNAAELVGLPDKIGVVAPQAYADLIIVDGDPLEDISILTKPEQYLSLVMKNGVVYRDQL
ncbi:metal-dependent hydrolase family protein [Williamsia sterculiae]|uniref:Imidazolonepropionase n=1 Tax=Williamsia sterculiae TaxID=1344003 RepID=A0A1N7D270_9NOCA|nr:amidohydrolase family protein [Williamsia sterculiae]SIR69857.1 Imidazolonepropionase [Williamsia sterculiae]